MNRQELQIGHMDEQTRLYMDCMVEVRDRISVVKSVVERRIATGYLVVDLEVVFLQLRKVLELIAFASLTANKEKYSLAHAKFAKHYKAKFMLEELEKINPEFYPVPVAPPEVRADAIKHFQVLADGFLTREDFASLYDNTGDVLHVPNPFSTKDPKLNSRYTPSEWVSRIQALLALHIMHLVNDKRWLVRIPETGPIHLTTIKSRPTSGESD